MWVVRSNMLSSRKWRKLSESKMAIHNSRHPIFIIISFGFLHEKKQTKKQTIITLFINFLNHKLGVLSPKNYVCRSLLNRIFLCRTVKFHNFSIKFLKWGKTWDQQLLICQAKFISIPMACQNWKKNMLAMTKIECIK